MATENSQATAETAIRARLDEWATALRAKDIDAIMAAHAPDVVAFDCHSQLQFKGADAYRRHLEARLPCIQGPMTFEIHDLDITAHGDVGFCHYPALCGATGPDGKEHSSWFHGTACLAQDERDVADRARALLRPLRSAERQSDARPRARAHRAGERRVIRYVPREVGQRLTALPL
jgi:ketosteroid isomerase-like protein